MLVCPSKIHRGNERKNNASTEAVRVRVSGSDLHKVLQSYYGGLQNVSGGESSVCSFGEDSSFIDEEEECRDGNDGGSTPAVASLSMRHR